MRVVRQVYLDHQAATPLRPEVEEAMRPYYRESFGSASSLHQHGLKARDALARAREQVAAFVNAESPEDILFTSDGTESANLAVKGTAWSPKRRGRHLVVSAIEHPSVLGSVEFLEQLGFNATRVPVNAEGRIDPDAVRRAMGDETSLLAVHHANHDLGTIQPVQAIAEVAQAQGVPLYVDAESSAGWIPLDVRALGVDLLSFSPHRFGGPKGVGVLYRHRRARLTSLLHGGTQENGKRAGTENIPAIVGAGLAAELAAKDCARRARHAAALQERLWSGLQTRVPLLRLNGPAPGPGRLCANLNISAEFVEGEGLLLMLDTRGIAVASGTSCVSKALKVSPVLQAIGLDHGLARAAILLTLGDENTEADIDYVLETLPPIVAKLRDMSPMWDEFQQGKLDSVVAPRSREPAKRSEGRSTTR
jgi:cysteine desulfurase